MCAEFLVELKIVSYPRQRPHFSVDFSTNAKEEIEMKVPATIGEFEDTFSGSEMQWFRVTGSPRFDYPIDYEVAVLFVDKKNQRIDFLSKWEPNCYCHFHRHLGETSVLVLEGEHHVIETDAHQTTHKVRKPGFFTTNTGGDSHMEYGGEDGTLVYFSCKAVGGELFDVMDKDGKVLRTATVDDFVNAAI